MKKRHTIGLLVATITDEFSNRVAIGAMEAAKQLDANLIIFPGKYVGIQEINELHNAKYEYQYNVLFKLAAEAQLDYLIVAVGTIAFAYDNAQQKAFLDNLGNTPILSVAAEIEGYDFLQFDNSSGISAAMDFLASHGRKHICMMVGDLNNAVFAQRYETYRKGLEANGLPYEDRCIMASHISEHAFPEIERLLDANPEVDAIMCATDIIAVDVCKVLTMRNLRVGTDVAVVGFDDLPIDTRLDPPLASVRADAVQLGKRAVEKAVNYLNGVKDEGHYLESQFIPRRSCFRFVDDLNIAEKLFSGEYPAMVSKVKAYFAERSRNEADESNACAMILQLMAHLDQHYAARRVDEAVVPETIALLDQAMPLKEDLETDRILEGLYVWLLRNCPASNIPYIQMLHRYFRAERTGRTIESVTNEFLERTHVDNIFIRDTLMFGGQAKDSYAQLMIRLSSLGALTAFLYTFNKPITHRYGDAFPDNPTWTFQAYCYGENVFTLGEAQRIATPEVFQNEYLNAGRQHVLVAADLFSAETQYGVALLEPQNETFLDELELITYQLSAAVRTLALLQRQEKLLDELHTSNRALDRMSKIDELTGIYNRKGFYPAAEELISAPEHRGKPFIVCYGDMDNLKMVNDTYGHAEGDFSIKLMARCLEHAMGEGAIVGRMGGDEFAAVVPAAPGATVEALLARKEAFIQRFNESGEKPYPFGLSLGMLECVCGSSDDLDAALDKADDLLYIEKRRKKSRSATPRG